MRSFETPEHLLIEDSRQQLPDLNYAYGAAYVMACYCGFESPPYPPRGQMQHGWVRPECLVSPVYAIWDGGEARRDEYHWVSRQDIEDYLRGEGYPNTHAIGLGMLYTPVPEVPRLPNSLLIMPGHSLYTTEHDWNFQQYLEQIQRVRDDFDTVTICVHPACMKKGYWVDAFREAGIEIVAGALFAGRHALHRMLWLMRRFEYVTTNFTGTHLAYAGYGGAKLSIYGTYLSLKREELQRVELYQTFPELMDENIRLNSEASMREHYGFLFCEHPRDAKTHEEWGHFQIGGDVKCSPTQIRDLFQWPRQEAFVRLCDKADNERNAQTALEQAAPPLHAASMHAYRPEGIRPAFLALRAKAEAGDAYACYELAMLFQCGLFLHYTDDAEAFRWMCRAAEIGHAQAQFITGVAFAIGRGVDQDIPEALARLELAARQGVEVAQEAALIIRENRIK